jgi:adenylate kinase family enzyme
MDRPGADRILVIGGMGSGKTTLARRIAKASGIPLHHLDEIARVGGGNGPARPESERSAAVHRLAESPRWIVEGIHLGWTEPLMRTADVIVWLDHVSWRRASGRILRRFLTDAWTEVRRQKGLRKFTRVRDYACHLRELVAAIPESRTYHRVDETADRGEIATRTAGDSRTATTEWLQGHRHKVVHCRTPADVQQFIDQFTSRSR